MEISFACSGSFRPDRPNCGNYSHLTRRVFRAGEINSMAQLAADKLKFSGAQ